MSRSFSADVPGSAEPVRLLVISGSMGAGKTTVLGEASDLLGAAAIPHAAMDVDAVAMGYIPDAVGDELAFHHVAAVWANHATFGITRLLLADAIDSAERRAALTQATRAQDVQVCRLLADLHIMQERVRLREPSESQQEFVDNVARVEAALDATGEDFTVVNDGSRSATAVAREVLSRAGWLSSPLNLAPGKLRRILPPRSAAAHRRPGMRCGNQFRSNSGRLARGSRRSSHRRPICYMGAIWRMAELQLAI